MKLIAQLTQKNKVYTQKGFGIRRGYLHYGNQSCEVQLLALQELADDEMLVSSHVIQRLRLPSFCDFDFFIRGNDIVLGPHIGILATKEDATLEQTVQNYQNYVYDYASIGGSIVVFSLAGINVGTGFVSGYVYHCEAHQFEACTVPFPSVLFKRIGTQKRWREYFNRVTNGHVFNDRLMSKWQVHKLLVCEETLKPHLPQTVLYERPMDVRKMLAIYPKLYLKHIYGSQGKGIVCLQKSGKWTLAQCVSQGTTHVLKSDYEVNEFLKANLTPREFIAQEAIDLLTDHGRKIDFRVLTVKGQSGSWQVTGMVARFGTKEKMVSNISSGGSAAMAYHAVRQLLNRSEKDTYFILQNMKEVAVCIGACLDAAGYVCGNLGVDLALDVSGAVWIIEVNNKDPNHTIAIDANNKNLFYDTKRDNMLYAKFLCGFGKECRDEAALYEVTK